MAKVNQNPEQIARDHIDRQLEAAGWIVQDAQEFDPKAGLGVAVREWPTDEGLKIDYLLIVGNVPCGLVEAKKLALGYSLQEVENQSEEYANSSLKLYGDASFLRFIYESTGARTLFRDRADPKPRSREIFSFFRPDTLEKWMTTGASLRRRLHDDVPLLTQNNLRDCQFRAIANLEKSFAKANDRALIQMATGSGKTFTAITSAYRLLKHAKAERILVLVDTRQLGEQMEAEFKAYQPEGEQYKFDQIYHVQRLTSSKIDPAAKVCISTIQRMYSILKGDELDEEKETDDQAWHTGDARHVEYNALIPPEFFDFLFIDECHRSIYNLWREVVEYFYAYITGMTATPDGRAFAFFKKNLVSEYTHEQAVLDGVNVGGEIYVIETDAVKNGGRVSCEQKVLSRDKLTREKRWLQLDEDLEYDGKQLDRAVLKEDEIRTVITEFKNILFTKLFPKRSGEYVPKTLIFAKDDSHADDIVRIVREVFSEGNDFCKKITYTAEEDPKSLLSEFRIGSKMRVAVTVDMIATGTDVRPLECLIFMRDVRSMNYFEQMKGRGTRTIGLDELQKVTPDAKTRKNHYVLIDAVGVCTSKKQQVSGTFEKKPSVSLDALLMKAVAAQIDADEATSLAGRLATLAQELTPSEEKKVEEITGGVPLKELAEGLYYASDADKVQERKDELQKADPTLKDATAEKRAEKELMAEACKPFTAQLRTFISATRTKHDQIFDDTSDKVLKSEWASETKEMSKKRIEDFVAYLKACRGEVEALQIFFDQPHRRQEVTLAQIKDFLEKLETEKPSLDVDGVWSAYANLGEVADTYDGSREAALLALIRRAAGIDKKLTDFSTVVDNNYKTWAFNWNNAHPDAKLSGENAEFMRHVRDYFKTSFHISREDFDLPPFDELGGYYTFKSIIAGDTTAALDDLNAKLAA